MWQFGCTVRVDTVLQHKLASGLALPPGTQTAVPRGKCLTRDFKVGNRVLTRDNRIQEIRRLGQRFLDQPRLGS